MTLPRILLMMALVGLAPGAPARGQGRDVVTIRTGRDSGGRRQLRGEVLDYTGKQLQIRENTGRESSWDAKRVVSVKTARQSSHEQADRLLDERRFELALERYRLAMKEENRRWVQREILSRIVWCHANQGDIARAGDTFRLLYGDDPSTPFFSCIPLSWSPHQPSVELQRQAESWLQDQMPAMRLLGASLLLSTQRRGEALAALRQLSSAADPRVALQAEAQIWRSEAIQATEEDCRRWEARIQQMPDDSAGPYYVLGRALSRRGKSQAAALALMRPPLLFAENYVLAAEALLAAAGELEKLKRPEQAITLYREVARDYQSTIAGAEAKQRILRLAAPSQTSSPSRN